jgi:hypothetical protein
MKQYARGILQFQQKHTTYPISLQQLQDARKPLMLRSGGKWPCPLTGKEDDWILVPEAAVSGGGLPGGGAPPGRNPADPPPQAPVNGQLGKLNKDLSPKDYVGAFVGVRPNATGRSFIALNGAEDYSEWVYTVIDLKAEIQMRQAAMAAQ